MATPTQKSKNGVVLTGDEGLEHDLGEAGILEMVTSSGDAVYATAHHGYGYKTRNEDRIAVVECQDTDQALRTSYFVIDGMGGHIGGDVAAQFLAEEFIQSSQLDLSELNYQRRELLITRVFTLVEELPRAGLVSNCVARFHQSGVTRLDHASPEQILRGVVEIVQDEAVKETSASFEDLRRTAEVVQALARVSVPGRTEIAIEKTKARLSESFKGERTPDACYIGGHLEERDGAKALDVTQVGDCKLFVTDRNGMIRFESINESYIAEPDLKGGGLTLSDLMMYSLNRNIVSNSVCSPIHQQRRYRGDEMPLKLHGGDIIYLYSDGCDDLFTPEEIIELSQRHPPREFFRELLQWSERRMRYVHRLLKDEHQSLAPGEKKSVYPAVHRRMNEVRLQHGSYLERYEDGTVGRWTKPPKCDNFALCMVKVS